MMTNVYSVVMAQRV